MTVETPEQTKARNLEEVLANRDHPMAACESQPWLRPFLKLPDDAAIPLAMSGPHPRAVGSYGAECIEWLAHEKLIAKPRWWQALAITRQLEHDEDGNLVYREILETGPRRIGKSVRLRGTALWRIGNAERIGETQLSMLVSKDLAIGKEIHRGAWRWAEGKDWRVIRLNGGQEIEAPGENRWLLRADNAVYGYDVGYGQVDESWSADPMAITDGLEPALLERIWPQLHLTSTAHVKASSLMRRRLAAALRGADPDVLLLLWAARPGSDYGDPATWKAASPHWSPDRASLVARKYAAALAGEEDPELDDPDPVRGWASQYLNVWPYLFETGTGIFPNWANLVTKTAEPFPAALGIASDIDQLWLSLGACGMAEDVPHIGSAAPRMRSTQAVEFIAEVLRIQTKYDVSVLIDPKGPASHLIVDLEEAGVVLTMATLEDRVQADADLVEAIGNEAITHGNYVELNDAVEHADWRTVNDRRLFTRKNGDISMLEAVSLAHLGAVRFHYDLLQSAW